MSWASVAPARRSSPRRRSAEPTVVWKPYLAVKRGDLFPQASEVSVLYQSKAFSALRHDDPTHQVVRTTGDFSRAMDWLSRHDEVAVDTETSGLRWMRHARIAGVSMAAWDGATPRAFYFPFRHLTGESQLPTDLVLRGVGDVLSNPRIRKILHNGKFDKHFFARDGIRLAGPYRDTMIDAHFYDENANIGLKDRVATDLRDDRAHIFEAMLDREVSRQAKACGLGKDAYRDQFGFARISVDICGTYGAYDASFALRLAQFYDRAGISSFFRPQLALEYELNDVLFEMEENGFPIDLAYVRWLKEATGSMCASLLPQLRHLAGDSEFEPNSDAHVRATMLRMGLVWNRHTEASRTKFRKSRNPEDLILSVDAESLSLFAGNPFTDLLLKYRETNKIHTTYTDSILEYVDADGVLHGDLKQSGTTSGRLSSESPNLQNMAGDDDDRALAYSGKKVEDGGVDPFSVKRAFLNRGGARSKYRRHYHDYSQIELRVMAHYTQDPTLLDVYQKGEDVHTRTALEVYNEAGKATRRKAKVINFGLCLAEGTPVLTDVGLVPIERVQSWHKVWDGVAWVSHDGLVCRGICEVITYDGVTATPEHEVFTEDGRKVPLRELASGCASGRIATGEVGGVPVGYTAFDRRVAVAAGGDSRQTRSSSASRVHGLWEGPLDAGVECAAGALNQLHLPKEVQGSARRGFGRALRFIGAAVHSGHASLVEALQGQGNPRGVYFPGAFHTLGLVGVSGHGFPEGGLGQGGQRRSVLSGELPFYNVEREQPKQAPTRVRVYDLLNAGPRHRFTASGKIVSNSYCMGPEGYAPKAGVSVEQGYKDIARFFERYPRISPFREEFWAYVRANGNMFTNMFGYPRRVPELKEPRWKADVPTGAERRTIGALIQGTAAILTKVSLVRLSRAIKTLRAPVLLCGTIHDEISYDVENQFSVEFGREAKRLMETEWPFHNVPIVVDTEYSDTTWAEKKHYPEGTFA